MIDYQRIAVMCRREEKPVTDRQAYRVMKDHDLMHKRRPYQAEVYQASKLYELLPHGTTGLLLTSLSSSMSVSWNESGATSSPEPSRRKPPFGRSRKASRLTGSAASTRPCGTSLWRGGRPPSGECVGSRNRRTGMEKEKVHAGLGGQGRDSRGGRCEAGCRWTATGLPRTAWLAIPGPAWVADEHRHSWRPVAFWTVAAGPHPVPFLAWPCTMRMLGRRVP